MSKTPAKTPLPQPAATARAELLAEVTQRRESGAEPAGCDRIARAAGAATSAARLAELGAELAAVPRRADWPYDEPGDLDAILAACPTADPPRPVDPARLGDQLLGAWQGRIAGCNLGKPIEVVDAWTLPRTRQYLARIGEPELRDYLRYTDELAARFPFNDLVGATRGNIDGALADDDTNYTVLGLLVLERHGRDFTTADVAAAWLSRLAYHETFTAERATYKALVNGADPLAAATVDNPYREWIGAQIRADVFGYVNPGNPRAAAAMAYRDARLSHVANGIYGEMWAAALVAAAFTADSLADAVTTSIQHVPAGSRLAEALRLVVSLRDRGLDFDAAYAEISALVDGYHTVHTINNAALVAAALLWAADDFSAAIGNAVSCGHDSDCNGATAGSAAGALLGARAIPAQWTEPLHDTLRTGVRGVSTASITDLARRTGALVEG